MARIIAIAIKKAVWAKPLPLLIAASLAIETSCSWIAIRRQTPPAGSAGQDVLPANLYTSFFQPEG